AVGAKTDPDAPAGDEPHSRDHRVQIGVGLRVLRISRINCALHLIRRLPRELNGLANQRRALPRRSVVMRSAGRSPNDSVVPSTHRTLTSWAEVSAPRPTCTRGSLLAR